MGSVEGRIGELTRIGEFKTFGEAKEYCRLHGLDDSHFSNNAFQIAGALMDARKNQDKITRHACAEIASATGVLDTKPEDPYEKGWYRCAVLIHKKILSE